MSLITLCLNYKPLTVILSAASVFKVLCHSSHDITCRCVSNNVMLLTKAFKKQFIIPNFAEFTNQIDKIYDGTQQHEAGQVSNALMQCLFIHQWYHTWCLTLSCRWRITSPSWLNSALISGEFLCARLMDRGTAAAFFFQSRAK